MVHYIYDAWGNHKVLDSSGNEITSLTHIGRLNPFRYRGYHYDECTGLYYLKTRYYDPEIGRFITIDGIEYADPETINGLNLYAYCGNNPVMNVDPTGTKKSKFWGWFLVGFLAVVSVALITVGAIMTMGTGVPAGVALLGAVFTGAGTGMLIEGATSIVSQGGFASADPWHVASDMGKGAATGAITGFISFGFSQAFKILGEIQ